MKTRIRTLLTALVATVTGVIGAAWLATHPGDDPVQTGQQQNITPAPAVPRPRAPKDHPIPRANDLHQIKSDMAMLQDAIAVLVENQSLTQKSLDRLSASVETSPAPQPAPEETPEQIKAQMEQQVSSYDQRLRDEAVDAQWANETLDTVENGLKHEQLAGIKLVEAACGSTLCKVELMLDPELPREESMQRLATHRSWDGPTFYAVDADGHARLFFARDGHELPN